MPIIYPMQQYGPFGLELGITYALLHEKFGFDLGEKYHLDIETKIRTNMEIDRAVFESYGQMGLGYSTPFPHASVSPFGTVFMPVMYGCQCHYAADADPSARLNTHGERDIRAMRPWTIERFENAEPVRIVLSQIEYLKHRYEAYRTAADDHAPRSRSKRPARGGVPHFREMSAQQNLGSVINDAFSVQGEQLYLDYITAPDLVRHFYANITDLMILAMDQFQKADGWPLTEVFVGNCSVAMISPASYARINYPFDIQLMEYARSLGARFMMHQDSDVNVHLENYTKFDYLHFLDFGQDTDFERVAGLYPPVDVNCLLFPSWIQTHSLDDIRAELTRLMTIGRRFRSFSFSLLEIDQELGKGKVFEFFDAFQECARKSA
jgi:hypothetical protein